LAAKQKNSLVVSPGGHHLLLFDYRSQKIADRDFVSMRLYIAMLLYVSIQKKVFCKSEHRWPCAQKIYKLRQTKLSQFVYFSLILREREETKTKYSAPQVFDINLEFHGFDSPVECEKKSEGSLNPKYSEIWTSSISGLVL
jgi:hypothetical protein